MRTQVDEHHWRKTLDESDIEDDDYITSIMEQMSLQTDPQTQPFRKTN